MKVTYSLSFEDYQFLQPQFQLKVGKNPGFRVMTGVCAVFAAFGLLVAAQGLGLVHEFPGVEGGEFSVGTLIVGLSAAGALFAYFLEKRSVRRAREKYGANIRAGYARIHCPDHRTFEVDAEGFVTSCRCGSVRRPWSELTRYSERSVFSPWYETRHARHSQVGLRFAWNRHRTSPDRPRENQYRPSIRNASYRIR